MTVHHLHPPSSNNLLHCERWDPLTLPSPHANELLDPVHTEDDLAFGQTEEADVKLDPDIKHGTDGYIDDGSCAVLDSSSN